MTLLPALLGFLKLRVLSKKQRRDSWPPRQAGVGVLVPFTARLAPPAPLGSVPRAAPRPRSPARAGRVQAKPAGQGACWRSRCCRGGSASGRRRQPELHTARKAYDLLANGFGPGFNAPLLLVAPRPAGQRGRRPATSRGLARRIAAPPSPAVAEVGIPKVSATRRHRRACPPPSPHPGPTEPSLTRPPWRPSSGSVRSPRYGVYVTGATALTLDLDKAAVGHPVPLFIGARPGLSFLLLMLVFRSPLVPAAAALMNLLVAGAAFGVVVAVFQWGWGLRLLGLGHAGPIEAFLPVMMLACCSGCPWTTRCSWSPGCTRSGSHTGDNRRAVATGQARPAGSSQPPQPS